MADPAVNKDQDRFRHLQQLLLDEDREVSSNIKEEVEQLRAQLVSPEEINARVSPFIEDKVKYLQENFPELFGPIMAQTIKQQIADSQDEMIDALYPIIGKLIKKFISKEMERLSEQIDRQINETFSWHAWKRTAPSVRKRRAIYRTCSIVRWRPNAGRSTTPNNGGAATNEAKPQRRPRPPPRPASAK